MEYEKLEYVLLAIPGVAETETRIICDKPKGVSADLFLSTYYSKMNYKVIEVRDK